MIKVKICGITRGEDLRAAVESGADSLGFVVGVPSSQRNLPLDEARDLIARARGDVSCVAVTVFRNVKELVHIYRELRPDYLQLHGALKHLPGSMAIPSSCVIGVVDGRAPEVFEMAIKLSNIYRFVLLDTVADGGFGGTGITHDWHSSRRIRDAIHPSPLILAGGLTPENVGEAVQTVMPYGVDVSSGVERKPGVKDYEKIFEFVRNAKEPRL